MRLLDRVVLVDLQAAVHLVVGYVRRLGRDVLLVRVVNRGLDIALALTHRIAAKVEYWPTADPTATEGNREQRLDAYRAVRDQLTARIKARFF